MLSKKIKKKGIKKNKCIKSKRNKRIKGGGPETYTFYKIPRSGIGSIKTHIFNIVSDDDKFILKWDTTDKMGKPIEKSFNLLNSSIGNIDSGKRGIAQKHYYLLTITNSDKTDNLTFALPMSMAANDLYKFKSILEAHRVSPEQKNRDDESTKKGDDESTKKGDDERTKKGEDEITQKRAKYQQEQEALRDANLKKKEDEEKADRAQRLQAAEARLVELEETKKVKTTERNDYMRKGNNQDNYVGNLANYNRTVGLLNNDIYKIQIQIRKIKTEGIDLVAVELQRQEEAQTARDKELEARQAVFTSLDTAREHKQRDAKLNTEWQQWYSDIPQDSDKTREVLANEKRDAIRSSFLVNGKLPEPQYIAKGQQQDTLVKDKYKSVIYEIENLSDPLALLTFIYQNFPPKKSIFSPEKIKRQQSWNIPLIRAARDYHPDRVSSSNDVPEYMMTFVPEIQEGMPNNTKEEINSAPLIEWRILSAIIAAKLNQKQYLDSDNPIVLGGNKQSRIRNSCKKRRFSSKAKKLKKKKTRRRGLPKKKTRRRHF